MDNLANKLSPKKILPNVPYSAVLKKRYEYEEAIDRTKNLGLLKHPDLPKNWDSLAALSIILKNTTKKSRILDAGGERYSAILPQLSALGYKNLTCINLSFRSEKKVGEILYAFGDITNTKFKDNYFHAITSLSVIEHGVNLRAYFKEMSRILKPDGILFTSTDYWFEDIETKNQTAFGVPIKIFNKSDIVEIINIAKEYNLELITNIAMECDEKVVNWNRYDLQYTFIYFLLKKINKNI